MFPFASHSTGRLAHLHFRLSALLLIPMFIYPQADETTNQFDREKVYEQVLEEAMADSIVTDDELRLLQALRSGLQIDEVIDPTTGETLSAAPPKLDTSGRWTMMAQNMAWAAGLYGWGLPYVLDINDYKATVASEMFSLGGSMYLTWKYTQGRNFPEARSQMQRHGELAGMHSGMALSWAVEAGEKQHIMLLMAAVPAGAWVGDRMYNRWMPSTGQAYALAVHSEFGRSIMSLLYYQLKQVPTNPDDGEMYRYAPDEWNSIDSTYEADYSEWRKGSNVLQAIGYPLGAYVGHKIYGERQYSFGDAAMLTMGRSVGLMYGLMISDMILNMPMDEQNMDWRYTITGTSLACLVLTDKYIDGYDYTFGQAAIMGLGGVAGGAFGGGINVLIEGKRRGAALLVISGSLAGFRITSNIIDLTPEYASRDAKQSGPKVSLSFLPKFVADDIVPAANLSFSW